MEIFKEGIIITHIRPPTSSNFSGSSSGANSIIALPDGKLVVIGHAQYSSNRATSDFAVVRYTENGILDTSFDGDGKVTTAIGSLTSDYATSVIIQADGKLVVAGYGSSDTYGYGDDFALVRYNANGTLDASFGGDGKVTTDFGSANNYVDPRHDHAYSIIAQSNGKMIVVGNTSGSITSGFNPNSFTVARYNIDGSLDSSFSGDGKLITGFGYYGEVVASANDVIVQPNGKLVVVGFSYNAFITTDFTLVRYNTNGSLDTTFGGDGKVTTDFNGYNDLAYSVITQADGKLVVAGTSANGSNTDFSLARYNANGSLDTTFGGDGKVTTDFSSSFDGASSAVIQSDGKLVVVGYSYNITNGHSDIALARYNTNGSLDTTFGGDGKVITDISYSDDYAKSVIIQPDGKLVVAGSGKLLEAYADDYTDNYALIRYNTDGSLDSSFGVGINLRGSGLLTGDIGYDTLTGDYGNDTLNGGSGNDTLTGNAGNDTLNGNIGNDWAYYNTATVHVYLNLGIITAQNTISAGLDTLVSIENLLGSNYNDSLIGNEVNNKLNGGNGSDLINGGMGNDTVTGDAGNDILIGGGGRDILTGGLGADKFKISNVIETGITSTTRDEIVDFKTAQADKINLSAIDANTSVTGNQTFEFIGKAAFSSTNATGQLRFDAANHIVYGSNDADIAPEFSILLTGVTSLAATDFIL